MGCDFQAAKPFLVAGVVLGSLSEMYIGQEDKNTMSRVCGGSLVPSVLAYWLWIDKQEKTSRQ